MGSSPETPTPIYGPGSAQDVGSISPPARVVTKVVVRVSGSSALAAARALAYETWRRIKPRLRLDQIAVARFRQWRSSGRVNLVYTMEAERVGAFAWNRVAVPSKRDPL